jgi:hypothetical protein
MASIDKNVYNIIHGIVTGVILPIIFYLLGQINDIRAELSQHEIKAAQSESKYAMRDDIVRVESKIDELRKLIIQEVVKK